jgi:signal transduction histidine kinase
LTLISGPIHDCLDEIRDQKIRQRLQMAGRNVDRLARLVDSLMDFSRLEAGRLEGLIRLSPFKHLRYLSYTGRYCPVLFGPYVEELAVVFRPVIEKASLEVRCLTLGANN